MLTQNYNAKYKPVFSQMFTNVNNIWLQSISKTHVNTYKNTISCIKSSVFLFVCSPVKKLHSALLIQKKYTGCFTANSRTAEIQKHMELNNVKGIHGPVMTVVLWKVHYIMLNLLQHTVVQVLHPFSIINQQLAFNYYSNLIECWLLFVDL